MNPTGSVKLTEIMKRYLQRLTILIAALSILAMILATGCAGKFSYSSEISLIEPIKKPYAIRVEIYSIPRNMSSSYVIESIIADIKQNMFILPPNLDDYEIVVSVRVEELKFKQAPWGLLWLPLVWVGVPYVKVSGIANVHVSFSDRRGERLAEYQSYQRVDKWFGIYYGYKHFSYIEKGVTPVALRLAMEDIKKQIDEDEDGLYSKLNDLGTETSESVEKVSAPGLKWTGKKLSIAISTLESNSLPAGNAAIITNLLQEGLWKTDRFRVIERDRTDAVIQELGFQMSGCTETQCAAVIGKALNVEEMIVGSLEKLGEMYIIAVRFVNVESVTVTLAKSVRYKGSVEDLPNAVDNLIESIVSHLGD